MQKQIVYFLCFLSILIIAILLYPNKTESQAVEVIEVVVPVVKPTLKEYAKEKVLAEFGSGWVAFERIITKESGWTEFGHHYPVSNKSSAWGLCGTLVKTHKVPEDFKTNPYTQIDWCIEYVKKRYGNPQKALEFHLQKNWF